MTNIDAAIEGDKAIARLEGEMAGLQRALAMMSAFVDQRGRHDGAHEEASYRPCEHCDLSYIQAEARLDASITELKDALYTMRFSRDRLIHERASK